MAALATNSVSLYVTVIKVIQYTPGNPEMIRPVGEVDVGPRGTDVVSASATPFGIVVELDDAIVVHTSSGETVELEGEPSNWRVFPRARYYANQLHVVRENCLEIYSFNHDYLVDQQQKVAGLRRDVACRGSARTTMVSVSRATRCSRCTTSGSGMPGSPHVSVAGRVPDVARTLLVRRGPGWSRPGSRRSRHPLRPCATASRPTNKSASADAVPSSPARSSSLRRRW